MSEEQALKVVEVTDEDGADSDEKTTIAEFDDTETAVAETKDSIPPRKKAGRPPHEPTETNRDIVYALAAEGIPQSRIASRIGVSISTLRKYYQPQLDEGMEVADDQVKQTLFEMATSGNYPGMTTWYIKRKDARDKKREDIERTDGGIVVYLPDNDREREDE